MNDRVAKTKTSWTGASSQGRCCGWLLGIVALTAGLSGAASGQEARPADASPASLARYVPRQDVFLLLEYDGLDAHADAWHATAAYKLLTETKLGPMIEDLAGQGLEMALASAQHAPPITSAEILALSRHAARRGGMFASWGMGPRNTKAVIVARGGDRPEVRRLIEAATAARRKARGDRDAPSQKAGRTLYPLDQQMVLWFEKGDLVLSDDPDTVLAVLDGKAPSAVDHPLRSALARGGDGFEPVLSGFLDFAGLPPMPPEAARIGLDGLKRLEVQVGFQDDALRSVIRGVAPSPRRGILALFDQPAFGIDALPPLPPDLTGFSVLSVDLPRTYDRLLDLVKVSNPQAADRIPIFEEAIRQQLGVNVRDDLFSRLGPKLAFYLRNPSGSVTNPMLLMLTAFSGLTISVDAHDEPTLARSLEILVAQVNEMIRRQQAVRGGGGIEFNKTDGPGLGYVLNLPPGSVPPGPLASMEPTILLGTGRLVIAGTTAAARKAMEPKAPAGVWQPTGAFVPVARRLPAGMVFLYFSDPRESFPGAIASLPILIPQLNAVIGQARRESGRPARGPMLRLDPDRVPTVDELAGRLFPSSVTLSVDDQGISLVTRESVPAISSPATGAVLVALLLPAVQAAREAARRAQCTNNLKQIALGMHLYHQANDALPRPAITGKDGKPLLSWRVAILPYIEQKTLYDRFHLDEPWDSPHNKALIPEMPRTYLCPSRANPEAGTTTYLSFVGPGALFEENRATRFQDVTDGTSNTLLVVESKRAVPWTKPDDFAFDPAAAPSLYGAGSSHPGGFLASFADGSVRYLKLVINPRVLRALITRAGGETIAADSF